MNRLIEVGHLKLSKVAMACQVLHGHLESRAGRVLLAYDERPE